MGIILRIRTGLSPSFEPKSQVKFWVKDSQFSGRELDLGKNHIAKLGINKSIYLEGLTLYVLSRSDFARFCAVKHLDVGGKIMGVYPLGINKEMADVYRGRLNRLPDRSRIMVVAEGCERRTIVHEALHDVFLGCFSKDDRDTFFKCIGAWLLRIRNEGRIEENDFFEKVNVRAVWEYNLDMIKPINFAASFNENYFSDEFKLFAGECFAYAGELLIMGSDAKEYLGKVPVEMLNYFTARGIISQRALDPRLQKRRAEDLKGFPK